MAFRDLTNYYESLKNSYFKMFDLLEDYDKRHKDGVLADKDFKRFEKAVNKMKVNYETITYFFMLWSKPDEKEKRKCAKWEKKYKKAYDYLAERMNTDKILKDNKKLFDEIAAYVAKLEKESK